MLYRDVHKVRRKSQGQEFIITEQDDIQAIKNSIRNIITTPKGTLPGDPEFGSRLNEILFSQIDGVSKSLQKSFVEEALYRYEPRVTLKQFDIDEIPEYNRVNLKLSFDFLDKRTGEVLQSSMNVPFDLI